MRFLCRTQMSGFISLDITKSMAYFRDGPWCAPYTSGPINRPPLFSDPCLTAPKDPISIQLKTEPLTSGHNPSTHPQTCCITLVFFKVNGHIWSPSRSSQRVQSPPPHPQHSAHHLLHTGCPGNITDICQVSSYLSSV